jgi:hypothetical protein
MVLSICLFSAAVHGAAALAQDLPEERTATMSGDTDPAADSSTGDKNDDSQRGNFLVLPIFITEPAIGEGLGAGVVYFHKKDKSDKHRLSSASSMGKTGKKSKPPPTATGAFGFYTSNDTGGVGVGHANSFRDDKYRVVGALANMRVNSTIFLSDIPFDFQLQGNLGYGNFKRRTGASNMFFGLSVMALDADVNFKLDASDSPPVDLLGFAFTNIGIAGSAIYDARDDSMMPSTGQLYDFTLWRFDDAIGSDFDYWSGRLKVNLFHQLQEDFVLGFRFDVSTVDGTPPFFAIPFVSLRGIPALRYQGKTAGVVEVEGRYNFSERWAAVAFAGAGFADADTPELDTTQNIKSIGAGVRYQALQDQNVWVGLDIAKGPEEYAWYIQVGHPW